MRIAAIAFTDCGMALGQRLQEKVEGLTLSRCESGGLARWTERSFSENDALVFIGAAGIAVRAIAPHVRTKVHDPRGGDGRAGHLCHPHPVRPSGRRQ